MRAGKLRHPIVIQQASESNNSIGEPIATWTTYAERRASIANPGGGESFGNHQINAEANLNFTLRHLSGVTTKMRVSFDSRVFDILAIRNPMERNKTLILECKEQV